MKLTFIIPLLLLMAGTPARAQWTRLTPFYPASIRVADVTENDSGIFAVGYRFSDFQGHIFRSFDDGAHWDTLQLPPAGFLFETIATKNSDTMFIGGYGSISIILWTTNGGHDWSYFAADPTTSGINDMQFLDGQHAFASGYDTVQFFSGSCYYTNDGGANWNQQTVDTGTCLDTLGLDFIQMTSVSTGYAVSNFGLNKYLLKTTDTGKHWNIIYEQPGIGGIYFWDENNGIMVAGAGKVFKTTNGGMNWTLKPAPTTQPLFSVAFLSASTGYAVGGNGAIIKTTDAGETWTLETSPTTQPLFRVRCFDGKAYATGDGGVVLRSVPPSTAVSSPALIFAEVHPNPAAHNFIVSLSDPGTEAHLSLCDLAGRMVWQATTKLQSTSIEVSNLPAGNYMLNAKTAKGTGSKLVTVITNTH
ncbi:MAG: T9SS type A sorting domain-containing protein [Taibaiella sp.]|nr:T9SS type A sorting domain-containing protein [Taibaiella sp.]